MIEIHELERVQSSSKLKMSFKEFLQLRKKDLQAKEKI